MCLRAYQPSAAQRTSHRQWLPKSVMMRAHRRQEELKDTQVSNTQALLTTVAANTVELWPFCSVAATKHSRGALSSNVFCSGVSAPAAPLALLAVRLVSLEEQFGNQKRKLEFVQGPVALNNARVYMRRRLQDCSGRNYKEGDAWSLTPIASTKSEAPAGRTSSRKKDPLDKAQTASGETSARRAFRGRAF